ncbi:GspH/FimT family pseudopilin [Aquisediminimonas profunda]|uniref:GspH/FimT family pseudopilin n=1 Tax=Aquisediminimonas profunda TaxID=1550733 RepID=UPI001C624DA8|nr:GspH/FimT family pseudopilin [Aquisediminimonas profunda]
MPISATGNSPHLPADDPGFAFSGRVAEGGFTLIELLVALTILGLMSAVVVLAIPDPRGRLVDEAERFAARTVAARDAAIVSARTTRLAVDTGGYAFAQRRSGDWRDLAEKPLGPARWTTGTTASKAEVEFDPTGVAEPETRIMLQRGDERVAVDIGADGAVRVAR